MAFPVHATLLQTMPGFVSKLKDLERIAEEDGSEDLKQVVMELYRMGEDVAVSLDREVRLRLSVQDQSQAISVAFSLSLQKLVHMNKCCEEMYNNWKQLEESQKNRVKAVQRPETGPHHHHATTQHGLSSPHGAPPPSSDQAFRGQWGGAFQGPIHSGGLYKAHQDKVMPGVLSKSLPAPSASSPSVTASSTQHSRSGGFVPRPVRKARSETDLRESDWEKQIKSLNVDNERLRQSEKGLRKTNASLQRKCKTLEKERDKAEDRLQVEQSNRDSLAKLRKRNEELESELKIICDTQVWKDRHQAVARDVIDATAKKISLGIPHQLNGRKMSLVSQSSRSPESSPVRVESEQAVS